jgi:hypothetical protein
VWGFCDTGSNLARTPVSDSKIPFTLIYRSSNPLSQRVSSSGIV